MKLKTQNNVYLLQVQLQLKK